MPDMESVQKHLTAISTAQMEYAKSSMEASKAYFEKLSTVKKPEDFMALTTEYSKSAYETFMAEATKIGDMYKSFTKEAFAPMTPPTETKLHVV